MKSFVSAGVVRVLPKCVVVAFLLMASSSVHGDIVTFDLLDVALFSSTPPSTITATPGELIPGGFDNSGAGDSNHLSSLQFDIDGDFDPLAEDPTIFFDFQIRTGTPTTGGQVVFDGFHHVFTPTVDGSYVVTKGVNSYLNLPFSAGDVIGDGVDEFMRAVPTWNLAIDEAGVAPNEVTNFLEGVDNFVGFRLDTGDFGWIRVQYDATGNGMLTFLDGAYENTGAPIMAGDDGAGGLAGDYNGNNILDAADYTVWRDAMTAASTSLLNDPTPGTVDESDFMYWRNHFGEQLGSGSGSAFGVAIVPEPSTLLLAAWFIVPLSRRRRTSLC